MSACATAIITSVLSQIAMKALRLAIILSRLGSMRGTAASSNVMASVMTGMTVRPHSLDIVPFTLPSRPQWDAMTAFAGRTDHAHALIAAITAIRKKLTVKGRRKFMTALL